MRTYRAEILRAASRSSLAFLSLCLAITLFSMANAGPQHQTPLWGFQQVGIFTATLVMGRAAVVAANDFSTGTIRTWLISVRSSPVTFAGKLAASMTAALLTALAAGAVAYAASGLFGSVPSLAAMASATGQLALGCVALSVFGHAAGVLTRNVPAALTVTIGWVLPAEGVLRGTSRTLDDWLPGGLLQKVTLGQAGSTAVLHAALPFVVLDLVALVFFVRRDVNS